MRASSCLAARRQRRPRRRRSAAGDGAWQQPMLRLPWEAPCGPTCSHPGPCPPPPPPPAPQATHASAAPNRGLSPNTISAWIADAEPSYSKKVRGEGGASRRVESRYIPSPTPSPQASASVSIGHPLGLLDMVYECSWGCLGPLQRDQAGSPAPSPACHATPRAHSPFLQHAPSHPFSAPTSADADAAGRLRCRPPSAVRSARALLMWSAVCNAELPLPSPCPAVADDEPRAEVREGHLTAAPGSRAARQAAAEGAAARTDGLSPMPLAHQQRRWFIGTTVLLPLRPVTSALQLFSSSSSFYRGRAGP